MKQTRTAVSALISLLALSATVAACNGGEDLGRASSSLDAPVPLGTFEGTPAAPGDVVRMVLMADGTAHLELLVLCPASLLPCQPAVVDGFYSRTETPQRLSFIGGQGQALFDCDYKYDGKTLAIKRDGSTDLQNLVEAPAWCAVASQCEQQSIPEPFCVSDWECVSSLCQSQCKGIGSGVAP